MVTTVRTDSETDTPAGSQVCKTLTEPPSPSQKLEKDVSPGPKPGWDILGGGWQVVQACLGRSWLTHTWVVSESLQEKKRQKGGIPISRAWFLEWLDSSKSRVRPCPLRPFPTPSLS